MTRHVILLLAAMPLLSACGRFHDVATVMGANVRYAEGRHADALSGYLAVGMGRYEGVIELDAATAFAALGETKAAMELFESLSSSTDSMVSSDASYNAGVLALNRGDYLAAIAQFRTSLRARPGLLDAARGLEEASQAADRTSRARNLSRSPTSLSSGPQGDSILDLIGRLESSKFKPGKPDDSAGKDDQ